MGVGRAPTSGALGSGKTPGEGGSQIHSAGLSTQERRDRDQLILCFYCLPASSIHVPFHQGNTLPALTEVLRRPCYPPLPVPQPQLSTQSSALYWFMIGAFQTPSALGMTDTPCSSPSYPRGHQEARRAPPSFSHRTFGLCIPPSLPEWAEPVCPSLLSWLSATPGGTCSRCQGLHAFHHWLGGGPRKMCEDGNGPS